MTTLKNHISLLRGMLTALQTRIFAEYAISSVGAFIFVLIFEASLATVRKQKWLKIVIADEKIALVCIKLIIKFILDVSF